MSSTPSNAAVSEFHIFPAIDLLDGQSVRLRQGARDSAQTVHSSPEAQLAGYQAAGARWVHVVHLNAAFGDASSLPGALATSQMLQRLVIAGRTCGVQVQVGGGVRSLAQAHTLLDAGVARVVIGTWAVRSPEEVCALARQAPEAVVVALDTLGGMVTAQGWTEKSALPVGEFGRRLHEGGVRYVLFTEVERDGMLSGVDARAAATLHQESGLQVLASGGVRDLQDIQVLASTPGVCGVICGRALAAGSLVLSEALKFQRP